MNQYSYICIDDDGQEVKGFLQASNDEAARIKLMEQGLKIVRVDLYLIEELSTNEEHSAAEEPLEVTEFQIDHLASYGKAVWNSESEFIDIVAKNSPYQIHGLPLSASLRTLAEETSSKKISQEFREIACDLEQGKLADDSFAQHLKNVPQNLASLIRAGAQTGKLENIIDDYIESQRFLAQSRHKILTSLFYFAVLILGIFLLFYLFMVVVVQNFKPIFIDFGIELPAITILTIHISDFVFHYGLKTITFLICISLVFWFSFDLFKMQAARRRLLYLIPVFGGVLKYTSIAQFCRMLATIIEAEIKLPEAIELASESTNDPNLITGCHVLKKQLLEGTSLAEASTQSLHFSKNFVHLFRWQDRSEIFIDSLRASSNIFQAKANLRTTSLVFALQPIGFAGVLLIILLPIGSLYLPLFKLLNSFYPYSIF